MISPIAFIERNENTIRNVFFILFLLAGIVVVKDYGLGWDDDYSRADTGLINVNFILHHAKDALLQGNEKYHGPFIEIVLVFIEKALRLQDLHSIYLMRHFVLFGIFFSGHDYVLSTRPKSIFSAICILITNLDNSHAPHLCRILL